MIVRPPRAIVRSISARMMVAPRANDTSRTTIGSPPKARRLAEMGPGPGSRRMRGEIEQDDKRDQHEPEPERERQIALARFKRNRRRHDARDAIYIAADDHHRSYFGDRAAESREQHRGERITCIPEERHRAPRNIGTERSQLLAVFGPRI